MINAICIQNEKEVLAAPELFFNVKPITITTITDSDDNSYKACINLEKKDDKFIIVVIEGEKRVELIPDDLISLDDLYSKAWKHIRYSNHFNMNWTKALIRRNDADLIAMCKCMSNSIKDGDIKRSFVGYDGKTHDLSDDEKLLSILDEIAIQTYVPAFAKALVEAGFTKKR